jgi:hypothetical protein
MDRNRIAQIVRDNPQVLDEARTRMEGVLARSATDAGFRAELLSTPHTALSSHFGQELPETVNIVFVENTGGATIVLPDFTDTSAELSDAELETVAGGDFGMSLALVAAGIVIGGYLVSIAHDASS